MSGFIVLWFACGFLGSWGINPYTVKPTDLADKLCTPLLVCMGPALLLFWASCRLALGPRSARKEGAGS